VVIAIRPFGSGMAIASRFANMALVDYLEVPFLTKTSGRGWNTDSLCDDLLECLRVVLAMIALVIIPPLLLFWIWFGILR
jgi:hypothetical protein